MTRKYHAPASTAIDLSGEELMILKASGEDTGASEALAGGKDFGQAGWSDEGDEPGYWED